MFIMQAIRQLRKAHNVPHWDRGKRAMASTERRLPRQEMIAQIKLLRNSVKVAVQISKQALIMIDRLSLSDEKDKEWAKELKELRLELKKVWHTGNAELIDEKAEELLKRMSMGNLPPMQDDVKRLPPDIRKKKFQERYSTQACFQSAIFKQRPSFLFAGSFTEADGQSRQRGDVPFVEWTDADDELVIKLCGMRNRHPLGHHFTEHGEHHELHPSLYEMIILTIVFAASLPALLPILVFLLAMAYVGPVDHKDEEIEKLKLEHEHEITRKEAL